LISRFRKLFGDGPAPRVALAPGRVNLIGDHTDYNEGWVLPMALDRHVRIAFRRRPDARLRAHSTAFDETREVEINRLEAARGPSWFAYVAGMAWALREAGLAPPGADLLIESDLPQGSGLSSSAALGMAAARALCAAAGEPWRPREMSRAGQRAENEFAGVACGVMDPLISAAAQPAHALLLDCRSLQWDAVPLPARGAVVVLDTRTPRELAGSAYNERRASCEEAVSAVRSLAPVTSLRDVDPELLEAARPWMGETAYRRASHVLAESARPASMAEALRAGDLQRAGALMNASHASLRELYEVSSPALDRITDLARGHAAAFGARLTGAGFGGCAVALVEAAEGGSFIEEVRVAYDAEAETPCSRWMARPVGGAAVSELASEDPSG